MTEGERERLFSAARECLLAALPDAWAIYAYGSFARGEEWPASDLDLAVLLAPGKTLGDPLGLSSALAALAGREVDLVDLRASGDTLRAEVLRDGRALFVADAELALEWGASAMSRYARHREQIRDLLADFAQTGVGYVR